jgi:hypothetical protein
MYVPNIVHTTPLKTSLDLKAQIDPNTMIVEDFYTPLLPVVRSSRKKLIHKHPN